MDNKQLTILGVVIIIVITAGVIFRAPTLRQMADDEGDLDPSTLTPTPTMSQTSTNTQMQQYGEPPEMMLEDGVDYRAVLNTNKGSITIDLNENDTPITVNNFAFLANEGFYNSVPFHRVMEGFMIQSGDPTGTGTGSPGYRFDDEDFTGEYTRGTIAMANSGPNTNGSQFFIMHQDYSLPPQYVIFGEVVDGLEVVDAIATVDVTASPRGEMSVPVEELVIESVEILEE